MNVLNKTKLRFFSEKKELALLGKKEFSMFFVLIGMVIISGIFPYFPFCGKYSEYF